MQNLYLKNLLQLSIPNKYTKWLASIVSRALMRADNRYSAVKILGYCEAHHIVPKSFKIGGEKDKDNIVYLSAKEHFIVHCLLVKMFDGKYKQKMNYAFRQLKRQNIHQKERYFNANLYAHLKSKEYPFVRLYNKEKVKYVYKTEIEEIQELILIGWSTKMTEEYKSGRVGGDRKGKFHTSASKELMSLNNARIWKNKHLSKTHRKRISEGNKDKIRTEEFNLHCKNKIKQQYSSGNLNNSGKNNPIYGKKRKTIYYPSTNERKFLEIKNDDLTEYKFLLNHGWVPGVGPRKRRKSGSYKKKLSEFS